MTTVGDVLALLDRWYDPAWAEDWDAVGLVAGDPEAPATRILVAVDPTEAVAAEARGGDLLLTHHPLFLGGTTSVAATHRGGRVLRTLGNCALFVAHTNADVADPGVSDALAETLGLTGLVPLAPSVERLDRWVVHVPRAHTSTVRAAMTAAGAGRLGVYRDCAFVTPGEGSFQPLPGAEPYVGSVGSLERVDEDRLEIVAVPAVRTAVAAAIAVAHPYEMPSATVVETVTPSRRGLGRVGVLPETLSLRDFCALVAERLPATAAGVRATGDPDAPVRRVAVAGGACLDLAGCAAGLGADVLVTSDARHHRAQESPLPVVDVAHWAGEWPWTRAVGARLSAALPQVEVVVSRQITDPWTVSVGSRAGSTP